MSLLLIAAAAIVLRIASGVTRRPATRWP